MQVAFPARVRITSCIPRPEGMRHEPFSNIDGEPFSTPTLNGFWRVEMTMFARGVEAQMALSAFVTAMSAGNAVCLLPIATQFRPIDQRGRRIVGGRPAPVYTLTHTGFATSPYEGFSLRAAASHRDSYIDVDKPPLARLMPGQYITLGQRLHQIVNAVSIDEHPDRLRLSLIPNVRGDYASGAPVIVDQLRLRVSMETGEPVDPGRGLFKTSQATFVEAFG